MSVPALAKLQAELYIARARQICKPTGYVLNTASHDSR